MRLVCELHAPGPYMGLCAGTAHLQRNLHTNVFVRGTLVNAIMEAEYEGILEFRSHEKSAKQGTGLGHRREEKPNVAVVGLWVRRCFGCWRGAILWVWWHWRKEDLAVVNGSL